MRPPTPSLHNRGERTITALTAFSDILQWSCFHSRDLNGLPLPPRLKAGPENTFQCPPSGPILFTVYRVYCRGGGGGGGGERNSKTRRLLPRLEEFRRFPNGFYSHSAAVTCEKREKKERKRMIEEREVLGWNNGPNFSSITLCSSQDGINDHELLIFEFLSVYEFGSNERILLTEDVSQSCLLLVIKS